MVRLTCQRGNLGEEVGEWAGKNWENWEFRRIKVQVGIVSIESSHANLEECRLQEKRGRGGRTKWGSIHDEGDGAAKRRKEGLIAWN